MENQILRYTTKQVCIPVGWASGEHPTGRGRSALVGGLCLGRGEVCLGMGVCLGGGGGGGLPSQGVCLGKGVCLGRGSALAGEVYLGRGDLPCRRGVCLARGSALASWGESALVGGSALPGGLPSRRSDPPPYQEDRPPPPRRWTEKCLWKHNLHSLRYVGGNDTRASGQ